MAWSTLGAVSSRALSLVASIIIARILGKSVFGELGVLQSTTNLYATFALFGGLTATKHVAEFRKTNPERAGRIIAMSTVVAAVGGLVMGLLMIATSASAARLLGAPHLQRAMAISGLAVLLIVINETLEGVLSGLEAFRRKSGVQFIAGIVNCAAVILGVLVFGLTGAIYGLIIYAGTLVLLNYQALKRETSLAGVPIRWREAKTEITVLANFSLPILFSGVLSVPTAWVANMLLVNTPDGYAEMGVFNAADRWRTAILFLPSLLGGVALPMLASLRSNGDPQRYHNLLFTNIKLSVLASSAVAAPVALFAPWIMASYGAGFRGGKWVLVVLCAQAVAFAAYWIVGQSLVSRGYVGTMFLLNLGWSVMLLASEWLLRAHGGTGLAVAYLIAETGRLIAALVHANRVRLADGYTFGIPRAVSDAAIVRNAP